MMSASSPRSNEGKEVRFQSTQEQIVGRLEPKALSTPTIDKTRSGSVGALSKGQNTTQPRWQAFIDMCDSRDGELCNNVSYVFPSILDVLWSSLHVSDISSPRWFDRFQQTQALVAQGRKTTGPRVRIAILDTGIDISNPYFDNSPKAVEGLEQQQSAPRRHRVKEAKSFAGDAVGDRDSVGHGTHCAASLLELAPNVDIYVARVYEDRTKKLDPGVVAKVCPHRKSLITYVLSLLRQSCTQQTSGKWPSSVCRLAGRSIKQQLEMPLTMQRDVMFSSVPQHPTVARTMTLPFRPTSHLSSAYIRPTSKVSRRTSPQTLSRLYPTLLFLGRMSRQRGQAVNVASLSQEPRQQRQS